MMRYSYLLSVALLMGCSPLPDIGTPATEEARPAPQLLPLETLLAAKPAPRLTPASANSLNARAAGLQERARRMQAPVLATTPAAPLPADAAPAASPAADDPAGAAPVPVPQDG